MTLRAQNLLAGLVFALTATFSGCAEAQQYGNPDEIQAQSAHDYNTPVLGGNGGNPYSTECAPDYYLTGVRLRFGAWANNVTALCNFFGSYTMDYVRPYGGTYGGGGGEHNVDLLCPKGMLVRGLAATRTDGADRYVANVGITCAHPNGDPSGDVTIWQNPRAYGADSVGQIPVSCDTHSGWIYYAKGIQGRAGDYLDSLGLICSGFAKVAPADLPPDRHLITDAARGRYGQVTADSDSGKRDWRRGAVAIRGDNFAGGPDDNPPCDSSHQPCRPQATQQPPCPRTPDRPRPCNPGAGASSGETQPIDVQSYQNPIAPAQFGRDSFRANDRVDWCRDRGAGCGAEAARLFCSMSDNGSHPRALHFDSAYHLDRTRTLGSHDVCNSRGGCTGFSVIMCSK
jgi:hypothetical protein